MMTNTVCTIVRASNEGALFVWQGACMWQEVKAYETQKYGEENADKVSVFIPELSTGIEKQDFIIKGAYDDYEYVVRNGLTVMSAAYNDYGSAELDHIEIGAR